jgi:hypothetical protein
MAAIDAIVFAVAAGFAFAVLVTVIVIIAVHREERRKTLTSRTAPGVIAQLARIVLGCNVREEHATSVQRAYDEHADALEHSMTTRV